jgi:hypothetical protein
MHFTTATLLILHAHLISQTLALCPLTNRTLRDAAATYDAALNAHNTARDQVNVAHLIWDEAQQASAQAHADKLAQDGYLWHSRSGENLWYSSASSDDDLLGATRAWIDERGLYRGEVIPEGDFEHYGHYSMSNLSGLSVDVEGWMDECMNG